MTNRSKKFLEFNGKAILFLAIDGTFWVALKPICEALNVNYNRQFQNLKEDKILRDVFAIQQMRDSLGRIQNMVSLPEKFIYGWLFRIRSNNEELINYQRECYEILWEHFNGTITQRQKLLQQQTAEEIEIKALEKRLAENTDYQRLNEIKGNTLRRGKQLKQLDQHIISENLDLWSQDFVTKKI